jgi:nicotinamide-nucleotide amidase
VLSLPKHERNGFFEVPKGLKSGEFLHFNTPVSMPTAEIFSQGDEVVTGEIADTNAAWLSRELSVLGFEVRRHTAVGDRLEALVELLRDIAGRADLCLCTGGLGPTCDDLTAEAVAEAFGLPLEQDPAALEQIETWFRRMGRDMPAINRKQALLPKGTERLDNLWGTAPGFALTAGRCRFAFMPGVPGEMKAMYRRWVEPDLPGRFEIRPARLVVLRTVGVGESTLQEWLGRIELSPEVKLGFRTGGPENRVKLLFPVDFPDAERDATVRCAAEAIGAAVYSIGEGHDGGESLETVLGRALAARNARLYAVETVSGGALAHRCGGETWFAGAAVETDPGPSLRHAGLTAGSSPVMAAAQLAVRARETRGAAYVLAQYGDFDREALASETARVEVHFALAGPEGLHQECRTVGGHLRRKQDAAAALGLDFARRCLAAPTSWAASEPG